MAMEAFSLFAKLTLDSKGFDDGLNKAKGGLSKLGGAIGKGAATLGSGLVSAAKAGAVAVTAATTAVGALVAKSVSAYSDYEQLVGGVQKLYGNMGLSLDEYAKQQGKTSEEVRKDWERNEEAAKLMMTQANNAFKTAGMSANTYMETATSFSAALINSLNGDTVEAAKMTDKAMTAISDNWNTFGGDIGMIQGAFQGFAKQNYTMLDNLKLGYGGTKSEMERLIADANEYAKSIGEAGNLTIDSFADVVQAIELVQKKQQIYGTTAREASTTIQGSLGMVKAAWENMVTGMADKNANLDQLINNLVDSIAGYDQTVGNTTQHVNGLIDNLLPVIEKALGGVSTLIEKLAPKIATELPKLINTVLPSLLTAGTQIVTSLIQGIWEVLPTLMDTAVDLMRKFGDALWAFDWAGESAKFAEKIALLFDPENGAGTGIIAHANSIIMAFVKGITESMPALMQSASLIMGTFVDYLTSDLPRIMNFITQMMVDMAGWITDNLDAIVDCAINIIEAIVTGLTENLPKLIDAGIQMLESIAETITDPTVLQLLIGGAVDIITALADGLVKFLPVLIPTIVEIILTIVEKLIDNVDKLIDAAIEIIMALAEGLINALPKLIEKIPVIVEKLVDAIVRNAPKLVVAAGELIAKLLVGIINALPKLVEAGMKVVTSIQSGMVKLFSNLLNAGKQAIEKIRDGLKSINPIQWGRDLIDSFVKGIKDRISKVKDTAEDIAKTIKSILGFSEPEEGPLSNFHTFAPDMMDLFIKGIKDNTAKLQKQVESSFDFADVIVNANVNASAVGSSTDNDRLANKVVNGSPITINVYGAEGQDVNELADAVSDRLLHLMNQTGAVYA